jgi:hypothetical protein
MRRRIVLRHISIPTPRRCGGAEKVFHMSADLDKYRRIGAAYGDEDLSDAVLLALWAFLEQIAASAETYPLESDSAQAALDSEQAKLALDLKKTNTKKETRP